MVTLNVYVKYVLALVDEIRCDVASGGVQSGLCMGGPGIHYVRPPIDWQGHARQSEPRVCI